jgi:hypothetical protein
MRQSKRVKQALNNIVRIFKSQQSHKAQCPSCTIYHQAKHVRIAAMQLLHYRPTKLREGSRRKRAVIRLGGN